MSKAKELLGSIRIWQAMVLILLVLTILFVFAIRKQTMALSKQEAVILGMQNTITTQNAKISSLSDKLVSVMGQLRSAVDVINQ